jgi:hypothetical protein
VTQFIHSAAVIFFWTLGILFFSGLAGCVLVIILTSIEDAKELFRPEEKVPKAPEPSVFTSTDLSLRSS